MQQGSKSCISGAQARINSCARGSGRSTTAAVLAVCAWCLPQTAQAACTNAVEGGTVVCDGTVSSYSVSGFNVLSIQSTATFDPGFSAATIGTLGMTMTGGEIRNAPAAFADIAGLTLTISNAAVNGGLSITGAGNSHVTIGSGGAVRNSALSINGSGTHTIVNTAGGFIQSIQSIGTSAEMVDNFGQIQNSMSSWSGQ